MKAEDIAHFVVSSAHLTARANRCGKVITMASA